MWLKSSSRETLLQNEPNNMTRVDVINYLLKRRHKATYLEIGVRRGDCFCEIGARRKFAVDPVFQIKWWRYLSWKNIFSASYFDCTSDDFFNKIIDSTQVHEFDVIFLDGLHTYEQSFRDVQNSLRYLKHNGWIVLHDCNPPNATAALPAESYKDAIERFDLSLSKGAWNGEVWKTVVRLRSEEANLRIFVLDCDEGLALIQRATPEKRLSYNPSDITLMSYQDLDLRRKELLDLRSPGYLYTLEF